MAALQDARPQSSAILLLLTKAEVESTKLSSQIASSFMGQFPLYFSILFAHQLFLLFHLQVFISRGMLSDLGKDTNNYEL